MMEETMEVLTMTELMRLTRAELCGLESRVRITMPAHPEGSPERNNAVRNLRNIRRVLTWYNLAPE
jgi:hypothetical protein